MSASALVLWACLLLRSRATGCFLEKDPVIQARAAARRVQAILRQMTGQKIHVTPVLLYVNWFVEPSIRDNSIVVMNQTYFYKTFDRLQDRNALPATQVDFLAAALQRYGKNSGDLASALRNFSDRRAFARRHEVPYVCRSSRVSVPN